MKHIQADQVLKRIRAENPWWEFGASIGAEVSGLPRRAYYDPFYRLVSAPAAKRAVLLMGPRRVGKTVLLHHAIHGLLDSGVDPRAICYLSIDNPLYNGRRLEELVELFLTNFEGATQPRRFVFFDEIQYLRDWEVHLKTLVDSNSTIQFIASGSAAAALRLKSLESGAGRFTDFLLPPLTFQEFLRLDGHEALVTYTPDATEPFSGVYSTHDISELNKYFVDYLNFGGYPEVVRNTAVRSDLTRFVKADIVDKVLLRDLPSLYGIQDIQELNSLFTTLAFNTAQEVSIDQLSKTSGVAKNTLKRYVEYLEAAFLIKVVRRVDHNAKRFKRDTCFKVYLTNPSIRAALFAPIDADDPEIGALAETAIFAQWFHDERTHHYARWNKGEVDLVYVDGSQKAIWVTEVKWSDGVVDRPSDLRAVVEFCKRNQLGRALVTTRTRETKIAIDGITIEFRPASIHCFTIGANLVRSKAVQPAPDAPVPRTFLTPPQSDLFQPSPFE